MRVDCREDGFYIDGKYFYPIGFNYWPRDTAIRIWTRFDPAAIEREFRLMRDAGINCIRMFILWEDLNPEPGKINSDTADKFRIFADLAAEYGIMLNPTLLIGHMSGQDWFPDWMNVKTDIPPEKMPDGRSFEIDGIRAKKIRLPPYKKKEGAVRDIYTDKEAIDNAVLQIKTILDAFKEHPAILSWDLSNENQYWMKPDSPEIGRQYMEKMYRAMKEADPNHPVTYGMGKITEANNFNSYGPFSFAEFNDYYSVHVYPGPFYYPPTVRLLDYYVSWKPAFEVSIAALSGRLVQLQEFGISDTMLFGKVRTAEKLLYGYYNVTLWSSFINGATHGILSWCFVDFAESQKKEHPYDHKSYELYFGNFDRNYNPKPSGKATMNFISVLNKIGAEEITRPRADTAIAMPVNYNDYPTDGDEASDDFPLQKGRTRKIDRDITVNHNRALFSAFIFCRTAGIVPEFIDPLTADYNRYKLIIFPNLYRLPEELAKRISDYTASGGTVYISTNRPLIGKLKDITESAPKPIKIKKNIKVKVSRYDRSEFTMTLKNTPGVSYIPHISESIPFITAFDGRYTPGIYIQNGKGGIFYLSPSPEINHSRVRNMYRKEKMQEVYGLIADSAGVLREIIPASHLTEGILMERKGRKLGIAVNHEFKRIRVLFGTRYTPKKIETISGKVSMDRKGNITVEFGPYGAAVFYIDTR